jgi:hypothetical protein
MNFYSGLQGKQLKKGKKVQMINRFKGVGFVLTCSLLLIVGFGQAESVAQTTIKMDNAAILYSPFNWAVTSHNAKTINSGAYFKVFLAALPAG